MHAGEADGRPALVDFRTTCGACRASTSSDGENLSIVFAHFPGRTTTFYYFDDAVFELGLEGDDGTFPWFQFAEYREGAVEDLRRTVACCLEIRGSHRPFGPGACFDSGLAQSEHGQCFGRPTTCDELDTCLRENYEP